jgi:cell wall assembly regulator SMI1
VTAAPILTEDLLEQLAERWRTLRAPIATSLRPGLADNEIDALVAPLELRLPHEARVWWGWHDGTETGLISHGIGNHIVPLQLAQAVARYRELLQVAAEVTADDETFAPGDYWRHEWFPFAAPRRADLACDCAVPEGAPTPIRHVEFELPAQSQEPVAPSLGAVVSLWIEAIDSGAWTFDHNRPPGWETHHERFPHVDGWARNLIA